MSEERSEASGSTDQGQVTGYFVQVPAEADSPLLDIGKLTRRLLSRKLLILGAVATTTLVAVVYSFLITPVYRSETLLAPAAAEESQGGLSALLGQYGALSAVGGISSIASSNKDEAIAVLRSRRFTEDFIRNEGLLPVLFSERWDTANSQWIDGAGSGPTMADAYQLFNGKVRFVREDARRNLVTVAIEWTDPELAARWANRLVEQLNEYLRMRDTAEAERSIDFLNEQLEQSSVIEIRQGIYGLIENQIELVMLANVREEYAFRILDPAVPSDPDKSVRPNRRVIVILGFLIGLFLSSAFVLIRDRE